MTKSCDMKVVGADGSAFVTRVRIALTLKGIDYEYLREALPVKSELLLKSNPLFKRVPVVIHGDNPPMIESQAILEYLDEIKPDVHPLLPKDPSDRAQCRILAYIFDTLCYPWMKEFMLARDKKRAEELKVMMTQACSMLEEAFKQMSKGKPYFGGDDIGYIDVCVGGFLGWMKFYARVFDFHMVTEERTPKLVEWAKVMWSHEVVGSLIFSQEIHNDFLQMLIAELPPLPESKSEPESKPESKPEPKSKPEPVSA